VYVAQGGGGEEDALLLQQCLGLDDAEAGGLREIVKSGRFELKVDVKDEALF